MLTVLDEFSHECLAIRVARKLKAIDAIDVLLRPLSSCGAFLLTSGPTTDLSSSPRQCRNGSRPSVPRPTTSSDAALERTATSRALMPTSR